MEHDPTEKLPGEVPASFTPQTQVRVNDPYTQGSAVYCFFLYSSLGAVFSSDSTGVTASHAPQSMPSGPLAA